MTDAEFQAALTAAPRYATPIAYVADYGNEARPLWDIACLPFREFLSKTGYTRAGLARRFCIPLVTVDKWLSGERHPPLYVRLSIAEATGIIERR